MRIVEVGNLYRKNDDPYLPTQGIVIEASREEIAALDFNPCYAEVLIVQKPKGGDSNGQVRR